VSIGAVLADARWRSHLTVSEVSRQTRIREAIIWGIEKDDFAACGGDAYARGHIRAIARVVGTDPDPLIQEYDATFRTVEDIEDLVVLHPTAAARARRRQRLARTAVLGLAVLAIVGWTAYHFATAGGPAPHSTAVAAANRSASQPAGAAAPSRAAGAAPAGRGTPGPSLYRPSPYRPSPSPISTPRPSPSPTHSTAAPPPVPVQVQVQALAPVRASAFGPGGTATGDNPGGAARAIDGSHATAWRSDWYTTAAFGNLKRGTGLLLNMGRRVTITSALLTLGHIPGADVQLWTGNVPALADLQEVASAAGAGGTVRLWLRAPVRAKYVLIWFTRLPPDSSGTFQASVYNVRLHGHP